MAILNRLRLHAALLLPALLLVAGTLISALAARYEHGKIDDAARAEFDRNVERTATEVLRRFGLPVYGLEGARGVYAANEGRPIKRAAFRAYVDSRDLPRSFPGVRGFGFIERVERADWDRFVATERADEAPDFAVRQLNDKHHADLLVIKIIYPSAANKGAQGLDVGSEPLRRAAAEQAIASGKPAITGPVTLVQDQRKTPGVLLFLPVYRSVAVPATPEDRRAALVGLVYAPIVLEELLGGMPDVQSGQVDFELYDPAPDGSLGQPVFDADGHVAKLASGQADSSGRRFSQQRELDVVGRRMLLRMNSTPSFDAAIDNTTPTLVFVGGVLISALLAMVLRQQALGRQRAEVLAQRMTADLEHLAQVAKRSSNAVSIGDLDGRILWINAGFTRLTGYAEAEALGQLHSELLSAEDQDAVVLRNVDKAIREGRSCHVEMKCRTKDGRVRWMDKDIQPQFSAEGVLTGFMEVSTDITELRVAKIGMESALRESEALLSTLNRAAIVSQADRAGRIIAVNKAFCDISGYSAEELIGQNHRIVNSGVQSIEFWTEMWQTISAGLAWRGQVCNRAKNGDLYWVDTFIAPFLNDKEEIEKYVSIRTDITANKRAEEALRWNQSLMQMMSNSSPLGFLVVDNRSDDILYFNQRFCEIWGIEHLAEAMRQGKLKNRDIIPDCLPVLADVEGFAASCAPLQDEHNRIQIEDEIAFTEDRTVRRFSTQIRDEDDRYYGRFYIFEDISERKRVARALVQATATAQASSQAKSQFLANMSHEIRTPMNAILGMLALLRKTELTPRQADYASKSEGAARALLGLLNEILDFSKIEAGKMLLDPHSFALDQLLRDLSVILSASLGSKPVEVLFDVDPSLPRHLIGDAMRLQQILINLGGNAIKFTERGEVVLAIKVLQANADAVTLRFSVTDSGIGIAPEHQASIFSGFTQAEASTTRRFGGTGLGVAISQRFVALMGGELELESELGKGTCFFFTLTLPRALELDEPAPLQREGPGLHWRALLVDDNSIARELLERMATSLGWQVDVAESGRQAIEKMKAQAELGLPYQSVFVDWQMPDMDGWQTSQLIRELGLKGESPVVVMVTAHGREMLSQRSATEQAMLDGFLVKPITASMLFDAVVDARAGKQLSHPSRIAVEQGQPRLQGLRLLLVEDNANNQQVARELLEGEGAWVQIAQHGQEGIEAVAAADPPFDVVLMDLQMPVMDGFTAARYIRDELGMQALPIIAMTANAMQSDRDACLAVGMNEHVGKPFELGRLVQVIRKQAGWTEAGQLDVAPTALSAAVMAAAEAADVELSQAVERLGGKQVIYQRMLRGFLRDLALMPKTLQEHVDKGELQEASRLMHTLKGLAATLGAGPLSAAAMQAEKALLAPSAAGNQSATVAAARAAIGTALPMLQQLHDAMQAEQLPASTGPGELELAPVDVADLREALQSLLLQLRESDMAAMGAVEALKLRFGAALGQGLSDLDDAVSGLDFERAMLHCQRMLEALVD